MDNSFLLTRIIMTPAVLVAFTFKGYVQSKIAIKCGDNTPTLYGRDTLNPFKHIDIMGFIAMMLIGIGWMKPVQVDRKKFKNYYITDLKMRIAGLAVILLIGVIATITQVFYSKYIPITSDISKIIYSMLEQVAIVNCIWFILNLIPVAGFDGFNIVVDLLRGKSRNFQYIMRKYNLVIFLILVFPMVGTLSILDFIAVLPGQYLYTILLKGAASIII